MPETDLTQHMPDIVFPNGPEGEWLVWDESAQQHLRIRQAGKRLVVVHVPEDLPDRPAIVARAIAKVRATLPGPGRPKKAPEDKAERITIRVDPETWHVLSERARASGEPVWRVARRAMGLPC